MEVSVPFLVPVEGNRSPVRVYIKGLVTLPHGSPCRIRIAEAMNLGVARGTNRARFIIIPLIAFNGGLRSCGIDVVFEDRNDNQFPTDVRG